MAPSIPDRWLNYLPVGKRVEGTRFIAFKVPLRETVNVNVEEKKRLDVNILLKTVPKLGMIIDLTNTSRYYNPDSFVSQGLEYNKLMIPGHHTPQKNLVNKFKDMVLSYLKKNPDNDKLIGVHCTHGVNRTGYLICNFMISELDMKPEEAIDKFNTSRGHQIERKNYLDSLHDLNKLKQSGVRTDKSLVKEPISWRAPAERLSWRTLAEPALPPSPQVFDKRDRFERFRQESNAQRQPTTRPPPQRFENNNTFNRSGGNNRNYSSRYVNGSRSQVASNFPQNNSNHNNYHTINTTNNQFVAHAYESHRYDEQPNRNHYKVDNRFVDRRQYRPHPYQKPRFEESRSSAYRKSRFDESRSSANQKSRFDASSRSSRYQKPRFDESRPHTSAYRNRPFQRE
ncbi:unnamed protein product [Ceratitis capitata]|uniref:(Mediterranean fruit fly) hypothetical protein n=1 Tax=Ceratitis capitata TaxID=7213 RepID=A0A811VCK1_CERCA|nr:unnamed protein product [Ceratitis capitata]